MQERINRVINNHQLSCQDSNNYFYVLRGFKGFIDTISIPVKKQNNTLENFTNYYCLEEDWNREEIPGLITVTVTFNFFDDKLLDETLDLVPFLPLSLENINIFNSNNPLIGVSEDLDMTNEQRLMFLQSINLI
ncbi:hypothetical protein ERUR111494_03560 [Erysipelothrix urinaevulpis]|uniref:hypothetical protein n=1 Tax=Erysipelothrix urinaevulpis TaxID=2683717 RepID=UPI0013572432|nr:hypothetical protein [Erysipelothrix urinaevulpis]